MTLLLVLGLLSHAFADDGDWQTLIRSENAERLSAVAAAQSDFRAIRTSCEKELAEKTWPVSCFEVIDRELRRGDVAKDKAEVARQALLEICNRVAISAKTLTQLVALKHMTNNLSECKAAYDRRRRDLEYRAIDENPESVFSFRGQ